MGSAYCPGSPIFNGDLASVHFSNRDRRAVAGVVLRRAAARDELREAA